MEKAAADERKDERPEDGSREADRGFSTSYTNKEILV